MGRSTSLTVTEKYEIIKLHDSGYSNNDICVKTGRSLSSVMRVLANANEENRKNITQATQIIKQEKCENLVRTQNRPNNRGDKLSHDQARKKYFIYNKDKVKEDKFNKITKSISKAMNENFNSVDEGTGCTILGIYLPGIKKLAYNEDALYDPIGNAILSQFDNNKDYDYNVYVPVGCDNIRFRYAVTLLEDNAIEKHCIVYKNIDEAWKMFIDATMKRKHATVHTVIILQQIKINEYDRLNFNTIAKSFSW